jgi:sensor c-di-GMP phosphodiesterase-like protein
LADELELTVVAEGIETSADAEYLRDQNCTYGQGFLYSKAVPLDQFISLVKNWNCSNEYQCIVSTAPATASGQI